MTREPRVVIIGAGLAGITALRVFTRRGFSDVTVLEKAADVGGVWHWNRYPGLTLRRAFAALPVRLGTKARLVAHLG